MIVYHEMKRIFKMDVLSGMIADKIKLDLKEHGINDNSTSEFMAWNNSMHFMKDVLDSPSIPDDCEVSIEYQIPLTSKRVDFILTGSDDNNDDNVIIIELKQWSTAEKVDDIQRHTVKAFVGGNNREVCHPSYQAYSYKMHLLNYAEAANDPSLHLIPLAYLHNFNESDRPVLEDPIYSQWVKEAPVFLKNDLMKLQRFIEERIHKRSKNGDLLYEIDHGKIRPAKALKDCLVSMLKGNKEFELLDDQITVFDKCLKAMHDSDLDSKKRVLIIEGGPGTGKSVLAVNLLVEFIKNGRNAAYVTKNSAPRECYLDILTKSDLKKQVSVKDLFRSPFGLCKVPKNAYDCLIIDEAHRLVKKMYGDFQGTDQIKECIDASLVTVFLLDENQRVTANDIGTKKAIIEWASREGVEPCDVLSGEDYKLHSEFRCNGNDGYIEFIDRLLNIRKEKPEPFDLDGFDFRVYDDPNRMRDDLRKLNEISNKARMVAGYCYDWNVKQKRAGLDYDIYLKNGFKARWNLDGKSTTWSIRKDSFEEVGCIHSCQGMEFDYIGVIIGKDLRYENHQVVSHPESISIDDRTSRIRSCKDKTLADSLIKNTYKVLLTRGQKGCYIYAEDEALNQYIQSLIRKKV